MSGPFTVDMADIASDGDAAWFKAHPGRTARVRPFIEGELPWGMPCGDGYALTAVRQIRPGVRMRLPVYLTKKPADDEASANQVVEFALRVTA